MRWLLKTSMIYVLIKINLRKGKLYKIKKMKSNFKKKYICMKVEFKKEIMHKKIIQNN